MPVTAAESHSQPLDGRDDVGSGDDAHYRRYEIFTVTVTTSDIDQTTETVEKLLEHTCPTGAPSCVCPRFGWIQR